MGTREYVKADQPTFYFIGVTTGKSSIMKVFPEWAKFLGLGEVEINGLAICGGFVMGLKIDSFDDHIPQAEEFRPLGKYLHD